MVMVSGMFRLRVRRRAGLARGRVRRREKALKNTQKPPRYEELHTFLPMRGDISSWKVKTQEAKF